MAKRRRRRRPSDTSDDALSVVTQLARTPALGHSKHPHRVDEYVAQFSHFEEWVLLNRPDGFIDTSKIPAEHRMMIDHWPEAFEAYRHAMWAHLERHNAMNLWSSVLRSLLIRVRATDPQGYEEFVRLLDEAMPRFVEQKRNATQRYLRSKSDEDPASKFRTALTAFAEYYEIDLPLWFLGVLGTAIQTGRIRPDYLGGPNTRTPQGSLISNVAASLRGTPLETMFNEAYDPALRNAVLHNDYVLRVDNGLVSVSLLDGSRTWSPEELYGCVTGTAQLVESVQTVSAYLRLVESARESAEHADIGLVASTYIAQKDALPHAVIFQLWCFHEMDSAGAWLDRSVVAVESLDGGQVRVRFSERGYTTGDDGDGLLAEAMRDHGWIRVTRVPVAPDLGLGYPRLRLPRGLPSYEMVGVPDEHVVRVQA